MYKEKKIRKMRKKNRGIYFEKNMYSYSEAKTAGKKSANVLRRLKEKEREIKRVGKMRRTLKIHRESIMVQYPSQFLCETRKRKKRRKNES